MSDQVKDIQKTLISAITALLKDNKVVQRMFDDFDVNVDEIDSIPIDFADLKVSAKTKDGHVYLNQALLEDDDFKDDIHYIVHEAAHWLQQTHGEPRNYLKEDYDEYLDLPSEVEAFKYQVMFIADFQSMSDAETYVEELLDFHEFEDEARDCKRKELIGE